MVAQQGASKWRDILSQRVTTEATNPKGAEEVGKEGLSIGGKGRKPWELRTVQQNICPLPFFLFLFSVLCKTFPDIQHPPSKADENLNFSESVESAGGGGLQGGRLLSFLSQLNPSGRCASYSTTRASARLMGVCLGAFRGRSRRLFTKTYVSDYDRWGPGQGLGGGGAGWRRAVMPACRGAAFDVFLADCRCEYISWDHESSAW